MTAAKQISSTAAKSLIEQATDSTRTLTWLEGVRNSYATIDRYCIRLIEDMHLQKSWDVAAEKQLVEMCELAEAKIQVLDTALEKHREKHNRIMVALDNVSD
jgi:hypothetical protein